MMMVMPKGYESAALLGTRGRRFTRIGEHATQIPMSRIAPYRLLILNIEGQIQKGRRGYLSVEEAYKVLKEWTGQDFGEDLAKWKQWLKDNKKR
jgi:hypothetical protein